ncbi:MAG: hypothetical protein HQL15_03745 [Candidatus Omnitrophica bacterium]|nr:hypothetical protein [Candidatus Omnitrophota bacterium]
MQTKNGKTLTIFVVLITILLVSSTAIGFFMYQKESQMRKDLEVQLQQNIEVQKKLTEDLKDTKGQVSLLQDKNKEADKKINSLMDEMELNEGLRNALKKENGTLKESLDVAKKEKDTIRADLDAAAKKLQETQALLKVEQDKVKDMIEQVKKQVEAAAVSPVQPVSTVTPEIVADTKNKMELGKIVVGEPNDGKGRVLSVDKESEFIICNLGAKQALKVGDILSVYRADQYLGDVKISRVQEEMSAADFIPPLSSPKVHKNDIVIIKQS